MQGAPRVRAAGLVIKGDKLLLLERTRLSDKYFSVPGGGVEIGETPAEAAVREVAEETSVKAKNPRLLYEVASPFGEQYFYLCDYGGGEPKLDPNSSEALHNIKGLNYYQPRWVPLKKIAEVDMRPREVKHRFIKDQQAGFTASLQRLTIDWSPAVRKAVSKRLGQHWLFDGPTLSKVAAAADITPKDTVLEIGPGLGTLTKTVMEKAKQVVAVEIDERLASLLKHDVQVQNLKVVNQDILKFDLTKLPADYRVVGNIPYYLTSKLIRMLLESANPPLQTAILLQKEVGERIVAHPGDMSVLAVSVQYYAEPKLCGIVAKELFAPPPQVDSVILQLKRRPQPLFEADTQKLFRLVKAGFGEKRKKLKNSLAGGLQRSQSEMLQIIKDADLKPEARAQELSLDDWQNLYRFIYS